jgi:hypothetical protein
MRRREWLSAMRRELDETHGVTRLRWLLGMAWVSALGLAAPLVTGGVVFGVVGGTFGNHEVFLEVYRGGSNSWIGALALTVPTALVGLAAALLVLRRHRAALVAAYAFAALVALSAVISVANVAPVRPFLDDWERVTADPRAAQHADERRINSAIGAVAAAVALLVVARRRRPRSRSHASPGAY